MNTDHHRTGWLHRALALLALASLAVAPFARATVYKCKDDSGGVVYQETPCTRGKELRNFDTDPPEISVVPAYTGPSPRSDVPPLPGAAAMPKAARDTRNHTTSAAPGRATGDASGRKFIHQGMTEAEVLARIGRPDATSGGGKGGRWSYLPTEGDPDTVTTITFSGGTVSDVTRKVVKR